MGLCYRHSVHCLLGIPQRIFVPVMNFEMTSNDPLIYINIMLRVGAEHLVFPLNA